MIKQVLFVIVVTFLSVSCSDPKDIVSTTDRHVECFKFKTQDGMDCLWCERYEYKRQGGVTCNWNQSK
jgi:hypothetical protein